MRGKSDKEIGQALMTVCSKQLKELGEAGLPSRVLLTLVIVVAKGQCEISEETKEQFRRRMKAARDLATEHEDLNVKTAKFRGQTPNRPDPRGEELKKHADRIGEFLRGHRKDHHQGRDSVIKFVRTVCKGFHSWAPLADLLDEAFYQTGTSQTTTEDALSKSFRRMHKKGECP
jgi:hypothetical protein